MTDRPTTAELAAANFRKSSYSGGGGNECIECAPVGDWTAVRDSKVPHSPVLVFRESAFSLFLDRVKASELS